jgi:hypothetical protein
MSSPAPKNIFLGMGYTITHPRNAVFRGAPKNDAYLQGLVMAPPARKNILLRAGRMVQ